MELGREARDQGPAEVEAVVRVARAEDVVEAEAWVGARDAA
jgi:hypothetical protein